MDNKQKNYFYAPPEFFRKLVDNIAEKINKIFFKTSDAVTSISDKSTNKEIPTAKAVNDIVDEKTVDIPLIKEQAAINESSIGLQKKNLFKSYATSQLYKGVDFKVENGLISANGISNSGITYYLFDNPDKPLIFDKDVIITTIGKCVNINPVARVKYKDSSSFDYRPISEIQRVLPAYTELSLVYLQTNSNMDVTVTDFAVMIRYADIIDNTYEPYVDDLQTQVNNITGETQTVTLANTQEYPFNNSQQSVSLTTARQNTDYEVNTKIISPANGEQVGRVIVTDKLINGFKIAYTGSAKSVTIKCIIKGGML